MPKIKFLFLFFSIGLIVSISCSAQNQLLEKKLSEIDSIVYVHQGAKVIPIIDSLLKKNISIQNSLILKAYKIKALVQVNKRESALNLSNEILKNTNLKGVPLIRTYVERALIFEFSREFNEIRKALDFVKDYYKNPNIKKDELYGEYLYRLSSTYRTQGLNNKGIEFAKKAIEFGRQHKFENVEATGLLLLVGMTSNDSASERIELLKKALSLYKKIYNYSLASAMYFSIGSLYNNSNEFLLSKQYLDSAIPFAKKEENFFILSNAYKIKSSLYEKQGYLKKALINYKKYQEYAEKDQSNNENIRVSEINAKFNYEKESLKNKTLEQNLVSEKEKKNNLLIGVIILITLLGILVYLTIRIAKKGKEVKMQAQIIDYKNTELTEALDKNKLLLKELNHRVKNNLALILSLVKFQYNEVDEPKYKEKFQSLELRIKTIAAAHEQLLYSTENLEGEYFDAQEYLSKITNALIVITTKNVQLNLEAKNIKLNIDTMLPIGILINELMSNSIKHALFKDILIIDVQITLHQSNIAITYKDSGLKFKETTNKNSLGVSIINSMVKQLRGTIQRVNTEYTILLQLKNSKK